ncbi:hypothetical protein [Amycolatopsis sp. lyj-23]|uniref:hypothetical protein n=1 Tax=Amycolatopsis sp. lyj-23 TaxID=2789283 RepID=UPI00397CDACE
MSDRQKGEDGDDASGSEPPDRDPGGEKNPDRRHVLIWVIQLLAVLAATIHEVSRLLGR